jgi:N-hydroxyarylamine O-acetyltransferase
VSDFPLDRYLNRIRVSDVPEGVAGLFSLQEAHMRAIPFENIDPLLGIVPSLDPDDLVAKLIDGGRGGYCYEQNAVLGMALNALGYEPQTLLCRVRNGAAHGGARSHQAFVVEADDALWLCDVGFGGHGALHPVQLNAPNPQDAPNGTYRLRVDARTGETVLERHAKGDWISLYGFDGAPVQDIDLVAANFLCARWEGAPFSANLMIAFHAPQGRVALFNRALTRGLPPQTEAAVLTTLQDLEHILNTVCGLSLDRTKIANVWAKIETARTHR